MHANPLSTEWLDHVVFLDAHCEQHYVYTPISRWFILLIESHSVAATYKHTNAVNFKVHYVVLGMEY